MAFHPQFLYYYSFNHTDISIFFICNMDSQKYKLHSRGCLIPKATWCCDFINNMVIFFYCRISVGDGEATFG
jgi:hypothetical protein